MTEILISKSNESFLVAFETMRQYVIKKHPQPDEIDWFELTMALYEQYPAPVSLRNYFKNTCFSNINVRLIYRLDVIEDF